MPTTPTPPDGADGQPCSASDLSEPTGHLASWLADTTLDEVPPPCVSVLGTSCPTAAPAPWLAPSSLSCARAWKASPASTIPGRRAHLLGRPHHRRHVGHDAQLQLHPGFERDAYHPLAQLRSNSLVLPAMLAAAALQASGGCRTNQHNGRTD